MAERYRHQEVFFIQDNAPYHRGPAVREWLSHYGHRFHLCPLPAYSPEFNAIEPVWHYVRMQATHNRYHATLPEFISVLDGTLAAVVAAPKKVQGYLNPFCDYTVPLLMRVCVAELRQAIEAFIVAYNPKAKPFKWRKREVKGSQLRNTIVNLCN